MPHFTIEAQGESIPLSSKSVYDTLLQTTGGASNLQAIRVATEQLSNWETHPGYYASLQAIYTDLSLDQNIRHQAIIQLKNGIDKHWRKTSIHPISKEEKTQIRTTAIEAGIREPTASLALQNALLVAKIVRYEFPHDWPNVINIIIERLRNCVPESGLPAGRSRQDPSTRVPAKRIRNVLTLVLHIVKELATGRLQRTRTTLQQASSELFQVLGGLYIQLVDTWTNFFKSGGDDEGGAVDDVENSYHALKTIRRLIVAGFEHPHRDTNVQQFWLILQAHQNQFWSIWEHAERGKALESCVDDVVAKHIFLLSKLHLDMARAHPASFVLLEGTMMLLGNYWVMVTELGKKFGTEMTLRGWNRWKISNEGDRISDMPPLEKLALKGLLILRACVKMAYNPAQTFKYQQPQDKEDKKRSVEFIKSMVLTEPFVWQIMEILVTQFFVLRPSDLRDWQEEPDEWERREGEVADAWEFSLRACSEKLFLDLVINYKELLVPRLLKVFYQYASPSNDQIFLKDSLYSAVGTAAACLEDKLDFNTFLQSTLVPEVQIDKPDYNLLRRRIAILLGQWVPIKPDTLDRRAVYQIFTHLLSKDDGINDSVVRVTAGRQLRLVLEPFEFSYTDFAPYATPILRSLMTLIQETELSETKMALLETVRVAVTKLEGHVEAYTDDIMSMLPSLWLESGEQHLMKQAILTMITAIVSSLRQNSLAYHPTILPLIRDSVQPYSETLVYLLEEALDLWHGVLQQTPSSNPPLQLLSLSTCLIPLLELGSDSLRQVLDLLDSYTVLSPPTMLSTSLLPLLLRACLPLLDTNNTRQREIATVLHIIEQLIASLSLSSHFPPGSQIRRQVVQDLITALFETGFLTNILLPLHSAYIHHQETRPSRKPPSVIGVTETALFSVLARLALLEPSIFIHAVNKAEDSENAIIWLVAEWTHHFDSIGDISRKKLQTLAITGLLSASFPPPTFMLEQLQNLMTTWTDVITELGEEAPEERQGDYLWYGPPQPLEYRDGAETPEDQRRRDLSGVDPTYTVNIRSFVAERLRDAVQGCGGEQLFQQEWLGRVDGAVVKGFADLGIM